ncbi:hypothetical protein BHE74_00027382 [Ensete ventricosum]|nr:hypothetical protein GW17_00049696 [Ensete ventricosum]RWW65312.1 hypothetical protein BHE74_00027382 [Ensete ventricosum]
MVRRLDPRRCSAAREAVLLEACGTGEGSHVGGSGARSPAGKERTSPSRVDPSVKKSTRPKSMKDLCQMRAQSKDELFLALHMIELPDGTSRATRRQTVLERYFIQG